MKVIDMKMAGGILRLAKEVNEQALKRDLDAVAAIPKNAISRRERERLLVRKAIAHLPQNSRLIVFFRFWEGAAIGEIAETMNLSRDAVRITYLIALSYLERQLAPYILESCFFTKEQMTAV